MHTRPHASTVWRRGGAGRDKHTLSLMFTRGWLLSVYTIDYRLVINHGRWALESRAAHCFQRRFESRTKQKSQLSFWTFRTFSRYVLQDTLIAAASLPVLSKFNCRRNTVGALTHTALHFLRRSSVKNTMCQFLLVAEEPAIPTPHSGCLLTREKDNVCSYITGDIHNDLLTPHADGKLMKFS